jgi:outer membrane receptor for ferric coprogen and ferric-rhodotorulic acid
MDTMGGRRWRGGAALAALTAAMGTGPAAAQEAGDEAFVLGTITVVGQQATEDTGAYAAEIPTGTAAGLALTPRETPQSVSVVTQAEVLDQADETLTEALDYATGVTAAQGNGELRFGYFARGSSIENVQYDGVASWTHWYARDINPQDNMAMYDRVEIVRGATGLLEGSGNPSASINLVRKRPTAERRIEGIVDAQSWGNAGVTFDASSALNDEGTVRGRFIANGVTGNGWRDDMEHDVGILYGTVDADLGDRTTASLGVAWAKEDIDGYSWGGLPTRPDGSFFPFYDSTTASALPWEHSHRRQTVGFVEIEHELEGGWTVVGKGRASEGDTEMLSSYMFWNEDGELVRSGGLYDYDNRSYSADVHATGPFRLFGRQHELVLGVSGNRDFTSYIMTEEYEFVIPDPADLGSPDGPRGTPVGPYWSDYHREQWGIYANSRWSVTDALSVFAGGRVSWFDDRMVADWGEEAYDADAKFVPYLAAVYDIDPTWTVYASYTGIFMPQSELELGGGFLPPVEGTNAEAGIKAGFFDGELQATAALFQTEQTNLAVPDHGAPCPPGQFPPCFSTPGEKVRTRGFELELTGAVTPRWNVTASYTYANSEYVEGPSEGERYDPSYSPQHLGKLATTYALPGALEGLTVGAGMRAQSGLYAEGEAWPSLAPFRIEQPGYAVFDAMARYAFSERTAIQLNVENLFDRDYYSAIADPGYGNFKGLGRSATLTLRHLF